MLVIPLYLSLDDEVEEVEDLIIQEVVMEMEEIDEQEED